jgi:deoxyribose-phosphate aldolase
MSEPSIDLRPYIDHTLLKPEASREELKKLCLEAATHGFVAVCIPPYYVSDAVKWLGNAPVHIATVVGFPLGYSVLQSKVEECKKSIENGAAELDIVVNIAAIKSGDWDVVEKEVDTLVTTVSMKDKVAKIIIETAYLTEDDIIHMCKICTRTGAHYIKTSTGWAPDGAQLDHIALMKAYLGDKVKIKASGGIRDYSTAIQMIEAGASRIGTSHGISLIKK